MSRLAMRKMTARHLPSAPAKKAPTAIGRRLRREPFQNGRSSRLIVKSNVASLGPSPRLTRVVTNLEGPTVPDTITHAAQPVSDSNGATLPLTQQKTSHTAEVLIELRDVHKSFGSKKILEGASFKICRGEAVGIIGASGSGKSTTLRLMAGLLAPDKGDIIVKGVKRTGLLSDVRAGEGLRIGMVFQSGALFDSLTVGENVGFLLYEHSRLRKAEIEKLVQECLAKVGLKGVESLYPSQLSGGMKKRVALARALVCDHRTQCEQVLMYDEPTAGLDPVASTVVEDLMRGMHDPDSSSISGLGISSYVVVTHQHSTIKRAVDRLVFLHNGVVAWEGETGTRFRVKVGVSGTAEEFDTTNEPVVRQFATGSLEGPIRYL